MVDVTKDNFSNLLCEFRTAVRGCDFVAVDCEFSGLDDTICRNNFDIPQLRYRRCRKDVNVYTPIQIGLTTFAYNSETSSYTARPFNFYIFPNGNPRFQPQCNIVCNTASLMFLVNQKFNLNKMVLKGIPFLSIEKEIELVEKVNAVTRKEESKFSAEKDAEKLKAEEANNGPFLEQIRQSLSTLTENGQEVEFNDNNAFQRSLIFSVVNAEFSQKGIVAISKVSPSSSDGRQRYILAKKVEIADESAHLKFEKEEKLVEIQDAVGFTEVMKVLAEAKKLLVGHNMLHDVMHIHKSFFASLPEDYNEFKESLNSVFPKICDTKVIASTKPVKDQVAKSSLDQLFNTIKNKPFRRPAIVFPKGYKKYESMEISHEAGYDSYMTGVIFIGLLNYLGSLVRPPKMHVPCTSDLLKPFINKIFIMGVNDMYYVDLENDDILPSRKDTFYLKFPEDWKTQDVVKLFEKFAPEVRVRWINNTSAFAQLPNIADETEVVMRSLRKASKKQDYIFSALTFDEWAMTEDSSEDIANPETPAKKSNGKRSSNDSIAELESGEESVEKMKPSGKKVKTV